MSFNPEAPTASFSFSYLIFPSRPSWIFFDLPFANIAISFRFRVVLCDMKFNAYGLTQVKDKYKKQTNCKVRLVKSVSLTNADHSFKLVAILYRSYNFGIKGSKITEVLNVYNHKVDLVA